MIQECTVKQGTETREHRTGEHIRLINQWHNRGGDRNKTETKAHGKVNKNSMRAVFGMFWENRFRKLAG